MGSPVPTRRLPERPDIDQLRRQAKELLSGFQAREANALEEVGRFYRDAGHTTFALHDAQLVLARSYGFESWPKLKAFVDPFERNAEPWATPLAWAQKMGRHEVARLLQEYRPR